MDRARVIAVIPARYASTRFPGKPLAPLNGRPMIAHVVDRVLEAACCDEVAVATDDERIAAEARRLGVRAVLTGEAASGSDRVALAVRELEADVVVNVQGDEPTLPPANVATIAEFLGSHREVEMATLAMPAYEGDLDDPNVVKVVTDTGGRALYFSRAAIPFPRTPVAGLARRHVGVYGFQREALLTFAAWPVAELERSEGLEQLRALANGMAIQVLEAVGESVAVDTPADVRRAEAALAALGAGGEGRDGGART